MTELIFAQNVQYIYVMHFTRSPFLTCTSRRAQSGKLSPLGKRVLFTESHTVLVISFFTCFFYLLIFS